MTDYYTIKETIKGLPEAPQHALSVFTEKFPNDSSKLLNYRMANPHYDYFYSIYTAPDISLI